MDLEGLVRHQSGVVSRRQALGHGLNDDDIARKVRRREWSRMYPGVYVDHTGVPTWRQRAWGATLLHAPAALGGRSALRAWDIAIQDSPDDISVVVAHHRRVTDPPGVHSLRMRNWQRLTQPHLSPPRLRLEVAALMAASAERREDAAVAVLADVVQQRRTTAARLRSQLDELSRIPRRELLADVLTDLTAGALSPLERRYLRSVERAHGLPGGSRQRRVAPGRRVQFRDVDYPAYALSVELDGRLGHEASRDRWADLDRDIRSLTDGTITIRAGWGQVLQPCRLAVSIARLLHARGWGGVPTACGPTCSR